MQNKIYENIYEISTTVNKIVKDNIKTSDEAAVEWYNEKLKNVNESLNNVKKLIEEINDYRDE